MTVNTVSGLMTVRMACHTLYKLGVSTLTTSTYPHIHTFETHSELYNTQTFVLKVRISKNNLINVCTCTLKAGRNPSIPVIVTKDEDLDIVYLKRACFECSCNLDSSDCRPC